LKIRTENLSVFYDGKQALNDINLVIPEKKITAVIGPSGCGKSTLLRCLNGLIHEEKNTSFKGEIFLDENNISNMASDEIRHKVGFVCQIPAPFPFSIYKNMTYASRYYGVRRKETLDALVKEKLQQAGLYEEVKEELDKSALKLSGGQQQRLCIARALTVDPEVLLLDEPCSALDVKSSTAIENLLVSLKANLTIVIVTHNLAQAKRIADKVVFLYNGTVAEDGSAEELFNHPTQDVTQDFLNGMFG